MMKFLFVITCALFLIALVTHLSTFAGFDPRLGCPTLWYFLQFSSAACLAAYIFSDRKGDLEADRFILAWALLFFVAVVYAVFNFMFTTMVLTEGCRPEIIDGGFALVSRGNVIRTISETEFIRQQVLQTRVHSGHWMMFILPIIATIYNKMTMAGRNLVTNKGPVLSISVN